MSPTPTARANTLPRARPGDPPTLVTIYRDYAGRTMAIPTIPNVWWTNHGMDTPLPRRPPAAEYGQAADHPTGWMMCDFEPTPAQRREFSGQWAVMAAAVRADAPSTVRSLVAYDGLGIEPHKLIGRNNPTFDSHFKTLVGRAKDCGAFDAIGIDVYPPRDYGVEAYREWATAKLNAAARACKAAGCPRLFVLLTVRVPAPQGLSWTYSRPMPKETIDLQINTAVSDAAKNARAIVPITWGLWGYGATDAIAEQDRQNMTYAAQRLKELWRC